MPSSHLLKNSSSVFIIRHKFAFSFFYLKIFSSFFSGEKKEAKKSHTKKEKGRRQHPFARRVWAKGHRASLRRFPPLLFGRKERSKEKPYEKEKKTASNTKRSHTATAFCGKRCNFKPSAAKRAHTLRARFVPKVLLLPFPKLRLSSLFLSSFSRKKKEKKTRPFVFPTFSFLLLVLFFFLERRKERSNQINTKKEARGGVLLFSFLLISASSRRSYSPRCFRTCR
ncbi:MAG: hypothetical protein II328_05365 [Clostridia bacterium]|nr:hypothetical protein [Clostridia bacterium]